jgi:aldehyde:ferredoxin oxidoreductase
MSATYGYTGKILRIDLSSGKSWTDDTAKYKDFIGGEGIGYKVLWDEVPAGTHPFAPENKIVFGAGPLCGSGVPCSGRTTIISLLPTSPFHGAGSSHMGGYFSVEMKYAGYDAIVLEGKSPKPVWVRIEDSKVVIEDARWIWGKGIFDTMAMIGSQMGKEAQVAAIGPAGENQLNMAVIRTGTSHSAGGHGGIMGAKNVKAIAIKGTGSVKVADPKALMELDTLMDEIIGANNQMVAPSHPAPWAEFHGARSRWTGKPGLFWGAANPPVETGECYPEDVQSIGKRTQKAVFDLGAGAEKYTVRMGGCAHCPIRCHAQLKLPQLEKYGMDPYVSNTCVGWSGPRGVMAAGGGIKAFDDNGADSSVVGNGIGTTLVDDLGVWCNYGQIGRDVKWFYEKGVFKRVLPAEEYASIPWDLLMKGDPRFLIDFYNRVAHKKGELWHIADGSAWIAQRWGLGDDYWDHKDNKLWTRGGYPVHHSNESAGQVGALISCFSNRDAQNHTHQNFIGSQLPIALQKEIAGELFGSPDALDAPSNYTRMNEYKARFVKWSLVRGRLHDSLTLCNWMWPMHVSPLKSRAYRGDVTLEAKFLSAVTGEQKTMEQLDRDAERVVTLLRALTVRSMGTADMRNAHDAMNKWIYTPDKKDGKEIAQFTPGTIQMEKNDLEIGLGMVYKQFGWDEKTGAPTRATLTDLGMNDVADGLASSGLLPA